MAPMNDEFNSMCSVRNLASGLALPSFCSCRHVSTFAAARRHPSEQVPDVTIFARITPTLPPPKKKSVWFLILQSSSISPSDNVQLLTGC